VNRQATGTSGEFHGETSLRWRRTVLWKQSRPDRGLFALQVRQDSLDHRRAFNAAVRRLDDDLDLPCAPLAGLDVNVEHSRCHPQTKLVARREAAPSGHAVKPRQIDAWLRYQGSQLGDEVT
jgi:hypothetical protein